jgi:hypothetical protein
MSVTTAAKNLQNKQENLKRKKNQQENLRRRQMTLLKKSHELAMYGVDVALILRQSGRFLTYRSFDHESWPPSMEQIVRLRQVFHISILLRSI